MADVTVKPRNTLSIKYKKVTTAYIAKKVSEDVNTTETLDYTFGSDGNNTSTADGKKKIATIIFNKETKNGHLNETKRSTLEKVQSALTKNEYNKGEVLKIPLLKEKVTFEKIDSASLGDEVYIVIKTENLQDREIKINIKQAKADGIEKVNKAILVQQNDKEVKRIIATVGEFGCDSKTIENAADFKDWAIAKVKLEPKDATKKKDYLSFINKASDKKTNLYLVIDAESEDNSWTEVIYDEVFDATPNVWLKEEGKQFGLKLKENKHWHTPVLNPQLRGQYSKWAPERSIHSNNIKGRAKGKHDGLDLYAPTGTPLYAVVDGVIYDPYISGSYGNTLTIKGNYKGKEYFFFYAHLKDEVTYKANDKVKLGEVIGYSGKTGSSAKNLKANQVHLHFEVRTKGTRTGNRINPIETIQELKSDVEINPKKVNQL